MLDLISRYIGALITIYSGVFFVKFILKEKIYINKFKFFISIILFAAFYETLYLFDVGIIRTFVGLLVTSLFYKYLFKIEFVKSVFASFYFIILLTISEITFFLLISICIDDFNILYNNFAGSIFSNILVSFLALIIGFILRNWLFKIVNFKIKNYIFVYLILVFACIILFYYVAFSNFKLDINTYFCLFVILFIIIVFFNLLNQTYKNNVLSSKYDRLLEFIKKYEIEIDNQRIMRHETKNQLLTIKSKLLDSDNKENIINYISELLNDNNKEINHSEYAKLKYLPNNGLKGLFYFKVSEALDNKINVKINVSKNISNTFLKKMSSYNFNQLGKLLGVYLDNAIESSSVAKNKKIGIEIYNYCDSIVFIISNTYSNLPKSISVIKSTKGRNRGHGLLLAKNIISNNNIFKSEVSITDTLYINKLIMYHK